MKKEIRPAAAADLPEIEAIYEKARTFMRENGNPGQWGNTYPEPELIREDLKKRQLYVLTAEEKICGVFVFFCGEEPTYRTIDGSWHSDAPYGTIHRVAGDGSGGTVAAVVRWAARQANYLRIDTHLQNLPMQRALQKAGFRRCGVIFCRDGSPREAFDRIP